MAKAKEHFNFDAFMNKIDAALLTAQQASVLVDNHDSQRLIRAANATVSKLRELRQMIDEPLVWFKMEKGLYYRKEPGKPWRPHNRQKNLA